MYSRFQLLKSCASGLILYGPPGTGKSLIAQQIGVMLNARDTKILNPLRFSQGNPADIIRDLFLDAEEEHRKPVDKSGLYVVVFDELDLICGLNRTDGNNVANLLLSKVRQAERPPMTLTTTLGHRWMNSDF